MTVTQFEAIGDILAMIGALGVAVFSISYMAFFSWSKTLAGRAVLIFTVALALWGAHSTAMIFFPYYLGWVWVRLVIFAFTAIAAWGLVVSLWRSWALTPTLEDPNPTKEEKDNGN